MSVKRFRVLNYIGRYINVVYYYYYYYYFNVSISRAILPNMTSLLDVFIYLFVNLSIDLFAYVYTIVNSYYGC